VLISPPFCLFYLLSCFSLSVFKEEKDPKKNIFISMTAFGHCFFTEAKGLGLRNDNYSFMVIFFMDDESE